MKILNLMGKKHNGKTYVSGELTKSLLNEGYSVYNDTFASELKKILMNYFNVKKDDFSNSIKDPDMIKLKVRNMLLNECEKNDEFNELLNNYEEIYETINKAIQENNFRKLIQYVGTEVFRLNDDSFWVNRMKEKILCVGRTNVDFFIIWDCRFINEFEMISNLNINTFNLLVVREIVKDVDYHQSEVELDRIFKANKHKIRVFNNCDELKFNSELNAVLKILS